eukprot:7115786-Pyramimonas_sp.AAC.8
MDSASTQSRTSSRCCSEMWCLSAPNVNKQRAGQSSLLSKNRLHLSRASRALSHREPIASRDTKSALTCSSMRLVKGQGSL